MVDVREGPSDPFSKLFQLLDMAFGTNKENESTEDSVSYLLSVLSSEVSKLNTSHLLCNVPSEVLLKLVSFLDDQMKGGIGHIIPTSSTKSTVIPLLGVTVVQEYIKSLAALDSCGILMNILTADNMPKAVYVEEVIETALKLLKYQLTNNVFPHYDNQKAEEDTELSMWILCSSTNNLLEEEKKKEKPKKNSKYPLFVTKISHQLIAILDRFNALIQQHTITDTLLLELINGSLPNFFVDGAYDLQLSALNVLRTVRNLYNIIV